MAITITALAAATASTTNATSYTGNAGVTAAGDVVIFFGMLTGVASIFPLPQMLDTGGNVTFTNVTSLTKASGADLLFVGWAYTPTSVTITPQLANPPGVATNNTGGFISCVRVAGSTITNTASQTPVQSAGNSGSTANPFVTFSAATNTNNAIIVYGGNGTNSTTQWTPPTGFTELVELAYNTPTASIEVAYRLSGGTATTYTWTNANTTPWGTLALEIAPAGGVTSFDPMGMSGFFGM